VLRGLLEYKVSRVRKGLVASVSKDFLVKMVSKVLRDLLEYKVSRVRKV
jgi:hypothetical protein